MLRSSLVVYAIIALTLRPAAAQQPSQAQRDAVRAACRSDFMANCAGVQPGGKDAFDCLVRNEPKLSSPCRSAVGAIASPASSTPASVPSAAAPVMAPNEGAPSGQGQSSTPAPPPSTKAHRAAAPTKKTQAAARTTTVPAAPAAAATAAQSASGPAIAPTVAPLGPIRPMLPRRALMILAQCRPDQQRLCAEVPAGGGQIFACLAANAQQLSPVCYDALARVSQ